MKVLKFKCGSPEWSVPVNELPADMKLVLRTLWRTFIIELGDSDDGSIVDKVDPVVITMLERMLLLPNSNTN